MGKYIKICIDVESVKKYVVVYIRVSNSQQDLDLQIKSLKPYVKKYEQEGYEICWFIDYGLSAMKLPMHQREGLSTMLKLIRTGEVKTLLVYERTRLARWFFEYMSIVQEIIEHTVHVEFSIGNGYEPFNSDYSSECVQAGKVHGESHNLLSRLMDKNYFNPSFKYGYDKIKTGYDVSYIMKEEQAELLVDMFNEALSVESKYAFNALVEKYKKLMGKDVYSVIRYLRDTFYTGYLYLSDKRTRYFEESIVPIIDVKQHDQVLEKIGSYIEEVEESIVNLQSRNFLVPTCPFCNKLMTFSIDVLGNHAVYRCKSKHIKQEKLVVSQKEYNQLLVNAMKVACLHMYKQNKNHKLNESIRKQKSIYEQKIRENEGVINQLKREISLNFTSTKVEAVFMELEKINAEMKDCHQKLLSYEKRNEILKKFFKWVSIKELSFLSDDELLIHVHEVFNKVYLYPEGHLEVDMYFTWLTGGTEVINYDTVIQ